MDSQNEQTTAPTEIQLLKARAATMGIQHSPNIGVEKLKQKITDKMEGREPAKDVFVAPTSQETKGCKKETEQEIRDRLQKTQMKLVRCRISCMNPSKADLPGEIVTVGNRFLGTVRKFIPFSSDVNDNGYHIENILLNELKSRKFQSITTKRKNGQIEVSTKMLPEFNIEILTPLTREELHDLAQRQSAAERLGG